MHEGRSIVGEYVGRISQQVRERPRYTIRAVLERPSDAVDTPTALADVRASLLTHTLDDARRIAEAALAADDAASAREAAQAASASAAA